MTLNDIMVNFAKALKEYCYNKDCEHCPFDDPQVSTGHCHINTPAYWNLSNTLDFPNSASKDSEDGSDPFDE